MATTEIRRSEREVDQELMDLERERELTCQERIRWLFDGLISY